MKETLVDRSEFAVESQVQLEERQKQRERLARTESKKAGDAHSAGR